MNEEEIKKQLKVKNKEIYINKLNLDLNNNMDGLVLTIDNLLNNIANDTIKKVLDIEESFFNQDSITKLIVVFIDNYRDNIMNELDIKKNKIIELFGDKEISKDDIININNDIKSNIYNYYNNNIEKLIISIKEIINSELNKYRIDDLFLNSLNNSLNNKILDCINIRDVILLNTFKESYRKYQELNKNTLK